MPHPPHAHQEPPANTTSERFAYCTLAQACARLGVSRDLILTWESQGRVRCVRDAHGHRHVRVQDIDALAGHQPGPLLPPAQAALVVGVQVGYLARLARQGRVSCVVLPSGQRRFALPELMRLATKRAAASPRARRNRAAGLSTATMRALTRPVPGPTEAPGVPVPTREAVS
ncbi:hypothetical protein [Nocardiopsis sp. FR6]|uniref:hypothetical protein n=1 Tax=Nocardiopsis sp. FR6 TaxID=2605986 RepID=UPI00135ADA6C|nr:hypothetical protein [Nocardiopsis sp. FR6]